MLVRGRNAQYIAEKFFISISTAKAHIHNIYRKLDVHSQQELINLVENVEMSAAPVPASDDQGSGRGRSGGDLLGGRSPVAAHDGRWLPVTAGGCQRGGRAGP